MPVGGGVPVRLWLQNLWAMVVRYMFGNPSEQKSIYKVIELPDSCHLPRQWETTPLHVFS